MNLPVLVLVLPMWVLTASLIQLIVDARPERILSTISVRVRVAEEGTVPSQFPTENARPPGPGMRDVRVVHHQDLNKRILVALIIASSLLGGVLLFVSCFWICRQRKLKNYNGRSTKTMEAAKGLSLSPIMVRFNSLRMASRKGPVTIFDYQLLEAATNKFSESNVLSEDDSGHVYKARFDDKFLAVVKKLDCVGSDAERKVDNEVNWLIKIPHQNIIKLLGYCIHGKTRLLVYEMMQNGTLDTQLHGPARGSALTWHLRLKIAVDVARGLEYLHEHCNPPVVHRDVKSSNILLDSTFSAKLSNFGLAVTSGVENKDSIELSGMQGYVAPEYVLDGRLTDKSDVYAFGVVLLELLMGRKPIDNEAPAESQSMVTWAMPQLTDRSKLPNIVDPVIKNTMDLKHLYQVAAVAVLCVQPEPSYRPLITDVLHSLIPLVPMELGGSLRVSEPASSAFPKPSHI